MLYRCQHAALSIGLGSLALAVGLAAHAGPLDPPAGPVAPAYKTLTEIEPRIAINATNTPGDSDSLYRIVQPGSYYLAGNITGVVGKHGIEIAAAGVTIDLAGFELRGVSGMGAFDGIRVSVNVPGISILNGTVRDWGDDGLDLGSGSAINSRIDGVRASGNADVGILGGHAATVRSCAAQNNGGTGIEVSSGGAVIECTAYDNAGDGIDGGAGSTVVECTAFSNGGDGIVVSLGSTVRGCTARFSVGDGIQASSQCIITGNVCSFSGDGGNGAGIHITGGDNRLEGNHCTTSDRGIDIDSPGNIVMRNTCSGNTTNWDIAAGNAIAPIVSATVNLNAFSGSTYGGSLGSTDPNANFTH